MKKKWLVITIIILISLHLKIVSVANFDVSLAFVLIPFWTFLTFNINTKQFYKSEQELIFLMLLLPFVSLNIDNWTEFFKTYFQFIVSYFLVIRAFKKPIKVSKILINKTLFIFQKVLLITIIIQFIIVIIFGHRSFFNIFGEYQLYYQLDLIVAKYRMKGFYLEPSFVGFICLNVYWTRFYLSGSSKVFNYNLIVTLGSLLFVNSAFAYVSLFIILYYEILNSNRKKASIFKWPLIFLATVIVLFFFSTDLFYFLRLNEFSSNSLGTTSGFMRVILPIEIVYKIIFEEGHYIGLTFGQLDAFVKNNMQDFDETTISNSFFLILGYFGFIGFIFYGFLIFKFIKVKKHIIKSFIILTFLNLNNSGAFMTMQYVFIAFLIPFLAIKYYENKRIYSNSSSQ